MDPISMFLVEAESGKKFRKRSEVIIIKDDKIFVGISKDKYMLPGGGIGKSETPAEAAKREATEEIQVNCVNLVQLLDPMTIEWPDIYGGEEDIISDQHKSWLTQEKLLGHITRSFRGDFSSYSESNAGPQHDKYKSKLIDPQEFIDQLENDNTEIKEPNRQWRVKWNKYTIRALQEVQKFLRGEG